MIFASVDLGQGLLEPARVLGHDRGRLRVERLNGDTASVARENVAMVGSTGGDYTSAAVYQFAPRWLTAMLERGSRRRIAANPEEDDSEEDADERAANKKDKFGRVAGVKYGSGELKWTPISRAKRWAQQDAYRAAARPDLKRWSALHRPAHFGYMEVKRFIESYVSSQNPETFFWACVFGMLTASEGTDRAEQNFAHVSRRIRDLQASGLTWADLAKRGLTQAEFSVEGSGFQDQRWGYFVTLVQEFPVIEKFLSTRRGLNGRDLRRDLVREAGRGIRLRDAARDAIKKGKRPPDTSGTFTLTGLGVTKLTFALEICGYDVACLDRWMLRALGAPEEHEGRFFPKPKIKGTGTPLAQLKFTNERLRTHSRFYRHHAPPGKLPFVESLDDNRPHAKYFDPVPPPPWMPFSDGAYVLSEFGGGRLSDKTGPALAEYEWWENQLRHTEYYKIALKEGAVNPLARAQWTQWEDILRHNNMAQVRREKATHAPVFWVLEGTPGEFHDFERKILSEAPPFRTPRETGPESKRLPRRLLKNPKKMIRCDRCGREEEPEKTGPWEFTGGGYRYCPECYRRGGGHRHDSVIDDYKRAKGERSNPIRYPEPQDRPIIFQNPEPVTKYDTSGIIEGAQLVPLYPKSPKVPTLQLSGPESVASWVRGSEQSPVERMYVILLDRRNKLIGAIVAGQGGVADCTVWPREVFAPAVQARASAIILAHNHPSGDPAPSSSDIDLTVRLHSVGKEVGIEVLDHVVVGKDGRWRSFREEGLGPYSGSAMFRGKP